MSLVAFPTAASARSRVLVIGLLLWLSIVASLLVHQIDHPAKLGFSVLVALVVAPILLLNISGLPIYMLAAYAASISFNGLIETGGGTTYAKLLGIATGISLLLSMFAMRRAAKPSKSFVVLLVLVAYAGATIFWAIDSSRALLQYSTSFSENSMLFATIALYPATPRDVKIVLAGTLCGAILAAAYGDYLFWHGQAISGTRLFLGVNGEHSIDPNEFAGSLLLPLALTLTMFLRTNFGAKKLYWLAALAVLFCGFALSGSRGGTIALAAIGLFLFAKLRYRWQLMAIGAALVLAITMSPIAQRSVNADLSNGDGRVDVWRVGIASLHQYWLAGAGTGNFNQAYMRYILAVPHAPLLWDRAAHSVFIGTAVELGLIGFLLTMAFWYLQFSDMAHVQAAGLVSDVCIALRAGILGLFVAGFSLSLMEYKYTWLAFSLIALMRSALAGSETRLDSPTHVALKMPESVRSPASKPV